MINADRYHHTGRTYVNISGAFSIIVPLYLGLTPQAKYLPPLRGSGSLRISVIPSEQLVAMKRSTAIGCESRDPLK